MRFNYELKNFKAFKSTGKISVKPLTLIFGPNSAGKSSIIQSLLMLKQTIEAQPDPSICILPRGKFVDVGNYRAFVHNHNVSNSTSIRFDFTIPPDRLERFVQIGEVKENAKEFFDETVGFEFEFGYRNKSTFLKRLSFYQSDHDEPLLVFENKPSRKGPLNWLQGDSLNTGHPIWASIFDHSLYAVNLAAKNHKGKKQWTHDSYRQKLVRQHKNTNILVQNFRPLWLGSTFRGKDGPIIPTFVGLNGYVSSTRSNNAHTPNLAYAYLAEAANFLEHQLIGEIDSIGPHRQQPQRHYVYSGNVPGQVGSDGGNMPDIIFKNDKNLLVRLNKRMKQLGISYKIQMHQEGESDVFSIDVFDEDTEMTNSIADVGFGVSQVLPILVQSLISSDSLLCIEQPEIHLHPSLQAAMGDIFIESAIKRNNTLILETHSEHLILRLLRRIRESQGKKKPILRKEDVCVLFVEPSDKGSKVIELAIDDDGDFIDEWPGGFFEEAFRETISGR